MIKMLLINSASAIEVWADLLDTHGEGKKIIWLIDNTRENEHVLTDTPASIGVDSENIVLKALAQTGKYSIEPMKASMRRIEHILRTNPNACVANRILTKARTQYAVFSNAHSMYLAIHLYRLAQEQPLPSNVLNAQGEVISLPVLFDHFENHHIAIPDSVSYGVDLDAQIAQLKPKNVYKRSGVFRLQSIGQMFIKKRVDYVIYYPSEISMFAPKGTEIESYRIADTTPFLLGRVSCAKGERGKEVVADINQLLIELYKTKAFKNAHMRWVAPSNLAEFEQYFSSVYTVEYTQQHSAF